MKLFKEVVTM